MKNGIRVWQQVFWNITSVYSEHLLEIVAKIHIWYKLKLVLGQFYAKTTCTVWVRYILEKCHMFLCMWLYLSGRVGHSIIQSVNDASWFSFVIKWNILYKQVVKKVSLAGAASSAVSAKAMAYTTPTRGNVKMDVNRGSGVSAVSSVSLYQ